MKGRTVKGETIPPPYADSAVHALLAVADRAVELARSRGADAAECFVQTGAGHSYSIEKNAVGFTSAGGEAGLGIRVLKDRRVGFAYCSDPTQAGDAAARALEVAKRTPAGPFRFPGPAQAPSVAGLWDPKVAELDAEAGLAGVRAIIGAAREHHPDAVVSGGAVGIGAGASALVNSEGVQRADRGTSMGLSAYVVLKSGDHVATGFKSHETTSLDELASDPAAIGREACTLAVDSLTAKPFGKGRDTTVVLHPQAAASLLEFITLQALHGDKAARGETLFSGMLGKEVADAHLRLTDDPTRAGGLGSGGWDDEGLPSRPVALLSGGRVESFVYDLGAAYEYADGPSSATASAVRAGGLSDDRTYREGPTTGTRNVVLETTDARSLDSLIGSIDDGVLVHDLLGAHTANPTSGDFSVSSTVLFRIQKGALAGALQGVMLAGNFPRLLQDHYHGASREREAGSGHFSPVCLDVPYLALDRVHVVGG